MSEGSQGGREAEVACWSGSLVTFVAEKALIWTISALKRRQLGGRFSERLMTQADPPTFCKKSASMPIELPTRAK
jgi:hypothetical protein